jgi:4-hydroxy-3-methylbut-2-enyl diphosphate reductase
MKVITAKTAGFCMGVGLALKKLDGVAEKAEGKPICTLGPIIHNPQVLDKYADLGVEILDEPDDAPEDSRVVIRAHGIPKIKEQELVNRGVTVFDATCPKVKRAQILISEHADDTCELLLFGEENHPEVKGLLSYAGKKAHVFNTKEELQEIVKAGGSYVLAAQTTQDRAAFMELKEFLHRDIDADMPVLETICDATKIRQQEAVEIADRVDLMVVVGGYNSGNTRRLVQVVRERGTPCIHVETADDIDPESLQGIETVGLSAGASTPDAIIREVESALERL